MNNNKTKFTIQIGCDENMKELFDIIKENTEISVRKLGYELLKRELYYCLDRINLNLDKLPSDIEWVERTNNDGSVDKQFKLLISQNKLKGGKHETE